MDNFYNMEIEKLIKEKFPIAISISYLAPIFLIGGALRDIENNITPKDLDFVVLDKTNTIVKLFIDRFNLNYTINKLGGYKISYNATTIDLWSTDDLLKSIEYNIEGLFYDVKSGFLLPFGYNDALENGLRVINPNNNINDETKKKSRKLKLENYIKSKQN